MKIFVANLAYETDEQELREFFSECGHVTEVNIVMDRETHRSRGFGFVAFDTEDAAQKALGLNGVTLAGRPLKIDKAQEKR